MIDKKIIELAKRLTNKGSFKYLGKGQHGIALLNNKNGLVYKITKSDNELSIAEKLKQNNLQSLSKIYSIKKFGDIGVYTKPYYNEINDSLGVTIGENMEDIADFFDERKNFVAEKSNTNLSYEFDNKFLKFLTQLKRDLFKLNLLPYYWDIDGLSLNTFLDKNNNYVLADF